jgi:BlaI family transcriptional regulator, penicillinase repressor
MMATAAKLTPNGDKRRSILDLAPFELDCMNAIWQLEEASVRQVQEALEARRPRAYTTIMTILDRLAQKGIVSRRRLGRAYLYRANLQPADAQESAVRHVVAGFFGGSRGALAEYLRGEQPSGALVIPGGEEILRTRSAMTAQAKAEEPLEDGSAEIPADLDPTLL